MAYVAPITPPDPLEGNALENAFQALVAGITGLDPTLVRPRWQPEPVNMPDFSQTWAAVGITETSSDRFVYTKQIDRDTEQLERDQVLTVMFSFYGPDAQYMLERFQDGIAIERNRADLRTVGIKLTEIKDPRQLPALLKEKWQKRLDVEGIFRRRIIRLYAQQAVDGAGLGLDNEFYVTPIIVSNPTP